MFHFSLARPSFLAALVLLAACSAKSEGNKITPNELGRQMFIDQHIALPPFKTSSDASGEYGSVDLIKQGAILIGLSYHAGDAYNKDSAPASSSEFLSGVKGAYSYCVIGINGSLDGDPKLMQLIVPDFDRLIIALLHPDAVTAESKSMHLPEIREFVTNLYTQKGGARAGTFRNNPTTYYIYGGWLWRGETSDNMALLCAYPIVVN